MSPKSHQLPSIRERDEDSKDDDWTTKKLGDHIYDLSKKDVPNHVSNIYIPKQIAKSRVNKIARRFSSHSDDAVIRTSNINLLNKRSSSNFEPENYKSPNLNSISEEERDEAEVSSSDAKPSANFDSQIQLQQVYQAKPSYAS